MSVDMTDHPFSAQCGTDKRFIWIGRPNETRYMRRKWLQFRVTFVVGCAIASICVLGKIHSSDPFQSAVCTFMLAVLPVLLVVGICFTRNSYKEAAWYALTDSHLLAATPDEGSFVIHKTELSNIKSVLVESNCLEVGTVRCLCYDMIFTLMSKNLKLENIDQPRNVADLILEAQHHLIIVTRG